MTHDTINIKKNKSVCDKYMHTMMNIIKFSSFALATRSLGEKKNGVITPDSFEKLASYSSSSHVDRRKRSQGPVQTYVIYGSDDDTVGDESFSDYIKRLHKRNQPELNKAIINVKSAAYITKFHEKNSRDISTGFPSVFPPPPPHFKM